MRRRDPFASVLTTLGERLRAGAWAMGEPLNINDLAQELRFSTTPVREALAFLSGQGVIEDTHGSGYLFPRLDEAGLADAYQLHELYVLTALQRPETIAQERPTLACVVEAHRDSSGVLDTTLATAALFEAVVDRGSNRLVRSEHRALTLHLGCARRSEASLFPDSDTELAQLAVIFEDNDLRSMTEAVKAYTRRRTEILVKIQSRSTREYKLRYTSHIV